MSKKILITGASSGFGRLTVLTLLAKGHKVAATMRGTTTKNKEVANELQKKGAHIIELDVTNDASVQAGVSKAWQDLGGIDVVVNNAGIGVLGLQENFTIDDWQKLFDVNVFGVQRVNRAILPQLREQQSGLLIHISSLLGRMTLPFYGPYNASKWALESMAENYRTELSGFGVDSVLVEPGGFPTKFFDRVFQPSDSSRNASYGEMINAPQQALEAFDAALSQNKAQDPQMVADAILKLIETPAGKRPFRTVVDKMGMGDHITPYNESLEQITKGIYSAFGMEGMLTLKTK